MSEVRDNWERLVQAVIKREELRQLAYCESLSNASSTDLSSCSNIDLYLEDEAVGDSARGAIAGGSTNAVGISATGAVAGGIRIKAGNKATVVNAGWFFAAAGRLLSAPAVVFARCRRWKLQNHFSDVHLGQPKRCSLRRLSLMDNFNEKNILARRGFTIYNGRSTNGGICTVYKGRLADGSLVAVKRRQEELSQRGELQFGTEAEMVSRDVQCNILHLLGFCMTPKERLLLYRLMVNGSVASWLTERLESRPPLDWPRRQRIALGSAKALAYLHDHCDPKIIHRDITASNILLDENFEAIIGGLGPAILVHHKVADDDTAVVRGTIGHIAPEYLSTGIYSEKTDVYSYGIMLLELITAQKVFDLSRLANDEEVMLVDWVKGLLGEKKLEMFVDTNLQGNCIDEEVEQLVKVALLCTRSSPMERPKMSEVIRMPEDNQMRHVHTDWTIDSTSDIESDEFLDPR